MCGIAAILGDRKDAAQRVEKMLSKIEHRGNFPYETWTGEGASLGTNRLAIVDEPHGKQPKTNKDETLVAVFNGEIFNYREIMTMLSAKGHVFDSESDTETLVHLYEEFGAGMTRFLDSEMYAFVIYDKEKNSFFAARDLTGVKPLYYAHDVGGSLYFASELKELVQFEDISKVNEFPPGHVYVDGAFIPAERMCPLSPVAGTKEEMITRIGGEIEEAVKKRVQTDLPIAVFLSGGVDSSLIMELATRYHKDVTALILGTESSSDFEYAKRLAEEKGWKYKVCVPDPQFEQEMSDIIYSLESWNANVVECAFANAYISKLAHELGYKVVLIGEGADELFAGFTQFLELPTEKLNKACQEMVSSLSNGSHLRVDKMAMKYTVETRAPFFDNQVVATAFSIPQEWKVGVRNGVHLSKFILREVAAQYLPEYIAWREKVPFGNGAGLDIPLNYTKPSGVLNVMANRLICAEEFTFYTSSYPECEFQTKEEIVFFKIYLSHGYGKYVEGNIPLVMRDVLVSKLLAE